MIDIHHVVLYNLARIECKEKGLVWVLPKVGNQRTKVQQVKANFIY